MPAFKCECLLISLKCDTLVRATLLYCVLLPTYKMQLQTETKNNFKHHTRNFDIPISSCTLSVHVVSCI